MENTNRLDEMRRYLQGQMSEEERADFDGKCQTDPDFEHEWAIFLAAQQAISAKKQAAAIREQLKKEGFFEQANARARTEIAQGPASKTVALRSGRVWWAIAAGLAGLVAAFLFFQKGPGAPSLDLMAEAQIGQPKSFSGFASRDTSDLVDSLLAARKPQEAMKVIANFSRKDTKEMTLREGRALLMMGQTEPALARFEALIGDERTLFNTRQAARYFAAVCFVEQKKYAKGREILESLASTTDIEGHPNAFAAPAKTLLDKLK